MKGCRPITDEEFSAMLKTLKKTYTVDQHKYKLLLLTMFFTGFRISEVLSLKFEDVWDFENEKPLEEIYIKKQNTKGKVSGKKMLIPGQLKVEIEKYISENKEKPKNYPLFFSTWSSNRIKSLSYNQVQKIFKKILIDSGLNPKGLSTHCFRKRIAKDVYEKSNFDIMAVKDVLGHASLTSTSAYLQGNDQRITEILNERSHLPLNSEEEIDSDLENEEKFI